MRAGAFLIALSLVPAGASAADEEPICADRPGKSSETCTVARDRWQIETGLADWTLDRDGRDRDTSLVVGETTIKYGLTDRSDIEVDVTPWQRATSRSGGLRTGVTGFGDIAVLYKHRMTSAEASLQLSLYPYVKVPTAKRPLGNREWEAGLLIPVGYSIGRSPLSVGLTPELDWLADSDGRGHHVAMVQAASLGWQANGRLSVSAEIWGQWDWDPSGTDKQTSADGSVAYLVSNDLQLDAGANFGLNRNTPDIELYAGVSKRF